jgi:uncharacterized caspase-like protein
MAGSFNRQVMRLARRDLLLAVHIDTNGEQVNWLDCRLV